MKKERKEYEQKYLSRYKQPKSTIKKSTSWTQQDGALGRLSLSPHFNAKRSAKQNEIIDYEKNIFHDTNNQSHRKGQVLIYTNRKYQNQNET